MVAKGAQDFSLRYPLVDGQGNFSSLGDGAAAMPKPSCLTPIASLLLAEIDRGTVDSSPTTTAPSPSRNCCRRACLFTVPQRRLRHRRPRLA